MQAYTAEADKNKSYGGSAAHQPATPPRPRYASGGVTGTDVCSSGPAGDGLPHLVGFILRLVAILTTFIATIVLGVNKQEVAAHGQPQSVEAMDWSQLQYFVAVNAIAMLYASGSLALSILNRRSASSPGGKRLTLALAIVDVLMVGFLFSAIGSASAISVFFNERPITRFFVDGTICDYVGRFCRNMAGAITMSVVGAAAFLTLTVLSIVQLHSRSI